jgi:hypothetical protein
LFMLKPSGNLSALMTSENKKGTMCNFFPRVSSVIFYSKGHKKMGPY